MALWNWQSRAEKIILTPGSTPSPPPPPLQLLPLCFSQACSHQMPLTWFAPVETKTAERESADSIAAALLVLPVDCDWLLSVWKVIHWAVGIISCATAVLILHLWSWRHKRQNKGLIPRGRPRLTLHSSLAHRRRPFPSLLQLACYLMWLFRQANANFNQIASRPYHG